MHNTLGPGLLESTTKDAWLSSCGRVRFVSRRSDRVYVVYRDAPIESPLKVDLVVEESVVVEVKAVQAFAPVHYAQVISYLKLTECPVGLLINFNVTLLKNGIRKVVRPDLSRNSRFSRFSCLDPRLI